MAEQTAIANLDEAISQAAGNMGLEGTASAASSDSGAGNDKTQSTAPTEKQEPKATPTPVVDPVEAFLTAKGITKEAFDNAVNLYQAVNDEKRAGGVIRYLQENWDAHQGRRAAAVEPSVVDLVTAELGPEFSDFAAKIAPAIEKIVDKKMRPVEQRFAQSDQAAATQTNLEITQEFAKEFVGEDNLPDHIADEMTRLVGVLPPSGKMPVKDYIHAIGKMALQNLNIASKSKTTSSPRPAAPPSPISRLAKSAAKPSEGVSAAPQNITLDEALKLADQQIQGKTN